MDPTENQFELIWQAIRELQKNSQLPDHFHSGFDVSKVKIQDLDTVLVAQATINPSNLADGAGETKTATVTGAALGDFVLVSAPYDLQGITVTAYVSAASTVSVRLQNESGGAIDLASGTWRFLVIKKII